MKKILVMIMAIGIMASAGGCKKTEIEPTAANSSAKAVIGNILKRTSIRKYSNKEVSDKTVETLLRAAMAAPTAADSRPWEFVVVRDAAQKQKLAAALPFAKMTAQAPVAIVVCGNLQKTLRDKATGNPTTIWIEDCSAATENLLLAASSLGLGAVWTAVYPEQERVNAVDQILSLPDNIVPLCVVPVGYPAVNPKPKDKWNPAVIHNDKW